MKVYQITEAPRVEPFLPKTLPTSVDIKPTLIGADLKNKQWNVVDQDGKVLQRFSGANAQGDAEGARDKLRNQIKANVPPANTKTEPSATKGGDDPDKDKKKGRIKKWLESLKKDFPTHTKNWMKTHMSRLLGSTVAGWMLKGYEISGIVSLYNLWFDEINSAVESTENNASQDVMKMHQKNLKRIRAQVVEKTTDLMVGSIAMTFGTSGAIVLGMFAGTAMSIMSGGALATPGILVNIFFGAMAAMGAYAGALWVCQQKSIGELIGIDVSMYDWLKNETSTSFLSPKNLMKLMDSKGGEKAEMDAYTFVIGLMGSPDPRINYMSPTSMPGVNSGYNITAAPVNAIINKVVDVIDHNDHSDLNRIIELSGVVQETKSKKIKVNDLPDELKKLAMLGAKTIQKANKENKST